MHEDETAKLRNRLDRAKAFLESLQAFTSPGQLKNLRYDTSDIARHKDGLTALAEVEDFHRLVSDLNPAAAYLATAEAMLPDGYDWLAKMKEARESILAEMTDEAKRNESGFRQHIQRQLNKLKQEYIRTYITLHAKERLGANADKRKSRLLRDDRLQTLQKLSNIDLMPRQHLTEFQNSLDGMQTCFALTEQELDASAVCPHCGFRPPEKPINITAETMLEQFDDKLEKLIEDWTQTLLANLEDPTTQQNIDLLKDKQKKLIAQFIRAKELPDTLSQDFIQSLKEVLSGLVKVQVSTEELKAALLAGGSPATPDEIRKRFEEFIEALVKGKESGKVRIVLE